LLSLSVVMWKTLSALTLSILLIANISFAGSKKESKPVKTTEAQTERNLEEIESLSTEVFHLLGEIEVLQNDVNQLKVDLAAMEKDIEEAKKKLTRISIASTPARGYLKTIKRMKPKIKESSAFLVEKSATLKSKLITLGLIKEKLFFLQSDFEAPLLKTISRQFIPSQEELNP